ncbi:thioredoxin-disulfide reductase [bacterium]|nr:thioredoxin-disulfide reductase [bacterium]
MNSPNWDVLIIGAGPSGLAAAIYAGRARHRTLLLEKGMPGGQILLTDWVENYPGFHEGVGSFQLIENFKKQAEKFGAQIETDEAVEIHKKNQLWQVKGNKKDYLTSTVIVATGSVYRKLGVEGEKELTGRGVSYCATCDGAFFKGKQVGIVGGGDHALTEALFLTKFATKVKLIHRRSQFRAEKILQERVSQSSQIENIKDSVVEKISGKDRVESVTLRNVKTQRTSEIKLDGLFISVGMKPSSGLVEGLLELDEWGQIKVKEGMKTSQPGIFGAGDVTNACPNQLATAVGTGVSAALSATDYLNES